MSIPAGIEQPIPERHWTPDEIRSFLAENVTVVAPGETLVIRIGEEWDMTPNQMREISDSLNFRYEDGTPALPFRSVVVPGTALGVVKADGEQ